MIGIDVSENNGLVDWKAVAAAGIEFAIIRLGFGNCHLDKRFYENYNGAVDAGLKVGIYYYDYGLDESRAQVEADFVLYTLEDCWIVPADLEMGLWFDMEDADSWKERHGMPTSETLTEMCRTFIDACKKKGFTCGVYSSLYWLQDVIQIWALDMDTPYWVAQWGNNCDFDRATLWQFTDSYAIGGEFFDADYKEDV